MQNKIKIIIGIVIAVVILLILISGLKNKCGDRICQRFEERRGGCPEDCKKLIP